MSSKFLRTCVTALIVFPAILCFLAHGFLIRLVCRDSNRRLVLLSQNVSRYSRFALKTMRLKIKVTAVNPAARRASNALIVCNHMSYLDMLILASVDPMLFVTSVDMGEVFFLGTMAEIGGSIFIERRNRSRVDHDIRQIVNKLSAGFNVVLFPEGTSSDGTQVLPFKKSLLVAASSAGKQLQPVTLKYREIDEEPFSASNRDYVCWYGKMGFLGHFVRLMSVKSVQVEVFFHERIQTQRDTSRDEITRAVFEPIASMYGNPFVVAN